jgi:hypothetical protein
MDYGPGNSADEVGYIEAIERHENTPIARIKSEPLSYFTHDCQPALQSELPYAASNWSTASKLREFLAASGARTILTGHWGDQVLFEQRYLVDLLRSLKFGTLFAHLRQFGRWYREVDSAHFRRQFLRDAAKSILPLAASNRIKRILNRRCLASSRSIYCERFTDLVSNLNAPATISARTASEHFSAIYEQVCSRRYQMLLDAMNKIGNHSGVEFAFPFLDRELLEFLIGIPGQVATLDGVPKGLLRRAMDGYLPDFVRMRDWKADMTSIELSGLEYEFPAIARYLSSDSAIYKHGIIARREKLGEAVEKHRSTPGEGEATDWSVENFLGLCFWFEAFDLAGDQAIG